MNSRDLGDIVIIVWLSILGSASVAAGVWCFSEDQVLGALVFIGIALMLFLMAGIIGVIG